MYFELKENKPHGTKDDPFSTYHIWNSGRSFQTRDIELVE